MADTIKKETFTIVLTYEMSVNIDTGEILETRLINRNIGKSDLKHTKNQLSIDDNGEPKLVLEDNKYRLSTSAISLMQLNESSKLVIKYEEDKSGTIPVIGTNIAFGVSSGNKLSKSNTVACRGSNHDELARYGTDFVLIPHPSKEGLFRLVSTSEKREVETEDKNVKIDDNEDLDLPFDLNIDEVIDDQDTNISEIDSSLFRL